MPRIPEDIHLVPSILDRLTDDEPGAPDPVRQSRGQLLRELKASVCRDLQNLLSTRRRCTPLPKELKELQKSLVNYGVRDFTGHNFAGSADGDRQASDREILRSEIENAIRTFEPRFKSVRVRLLDNAEREDRTVRMRIDAVLHAHPNPEPVRFDSVLEPADCSVEVREQAP
jgi:type VI secretion system protein ImpF